MRAGLIASIPSPARNQVHLGPVPLRGYALCVLLAVVVGVFVGDRRLRPRGYRVGIVADLAVWVVPLGLVGARLVHVATDHRLYLGPGRHRVRVLELWDGGLSLWGALALGAVGAAIGCRLYRVRLSYLADAMAVALPVAQAVGRWGNWFNQELYGGPSGLPWAVRIDAAHRLPQYAADATYQPAFLYESVWDLGVAGLVLLAGRRRWFGRLSRGRAFALYLAAYAVGRGWIEALRVDPSPHLLGLRLGDVVSIALFVLAVGYLVAVRAPADEAAAPGPGEPSLPAAVVGGLGAASLRPVPARTGPPLERMRPPRPALDPGPAWVDGPDTDVPDGLREHDELDDDLDELDDELEGDLEDDAEPGHIEEGATPLDALRSPLRER